MRCIPADYGWCALRQPAYKTASGETVRCDKDESCPDSYKCKRVAFFSICCPRHTEGLCISTVKHYFAETKPSFNPLLFYTNVAPDEIDEKTVMMDDVNLEGRPGYSAPLLLKSCDNDICPENSNCVQQEVLAYCSRY
uniref:WAP domain-containing protein n=1 Tax=Syphacia muris TaxID=451379 RepID=A0A0N5AJP6_9BILA